MAHYKHAQVGYPLLFTYTVVIIVLGYACISSGFKPMLGAVLLLMLLVLITFATLTVEVDDEEMAIRFGIPLFRKVFRLKEIESVRVVKNPWYYFLGIRYTPRGWLFAVSGNSAVELQMVSGKRYRIGTDEPAGLAAAVNKALKAPSEPCGDGA